MQEEALTSFAIYAHIAASLHCDSRKIIDKLGRQAKNI